MTSYLSEETLVRNRLKSNTNSFLEMYVRDEARLKHQDYIRGVRNGIVLYLNTLDEIAVRGLTIKYYFSEMTSKLLDKFELVTPSREKVFFAVQKSEQNHSM